MFSLYLYTSFESTTTSTSTATSTSGQQVALLFIKRGQKSSLYDSNNLFMMSLAMFKKSFSV